MSGLTLNLLNDTSCYFWWLPCLKPLSLSLNPFSLAFSKLYFPSQCDIDLAKSVLTFELKSPIRRIVDFVGEFQKKKAGTIKSKL